MMENREITQLAPHRGALCLVHFEKVNLNMFHENSMSALLGKDISLMCQQIDRRRTDILPVQSQASLINNINL